MVKRTEAAPQADGEQDAAAEGPPAGVIVGLDAIAAAFRVRPRTILHWVQAEAFPAATLPNGSIATSVGLIEAWLAIRMGLPPTAGTATGKGGRRAKRPKATALTKRREDRTRLN